MLKAIKKDDSNREGCLGVAKIHIANNFNELVGMDFVDYGGYAAFLHIQDTFRDSMPSFLRDQRERGVERQKCPGGERFLTG